VTPAVTATESTETIRRRVTQRLERRHRQSREIFLLKFMEIFDNLDRALAAAEHAQVTPALVEGIILVRAQLLAALREEGLERIPVLGLPFDPSVAEAIEIEPVAEPERHRLVLADLQRGYRLNGVLVRPARVRVGEYRAPQPAPEPAFEDVTLSALEAPPRPVSPADAPATPAPPADDEASKTE
jgi:molecular chaperone GrpE